MRTLIPTAILGASFLGYQATRTQEPQGVTE